jgi:1-acyl-sn-glycerol-3-phosphate acyltransferase
MNRLFRTIGHRLYTIWCVSWFLIPFLVTWPLQLLLSSFRAGRPWLHGINRLWSKFQLRMYLAPIEVRGEPHPGGIGPVIFCANHSSYIDIPVLFNAIPGFTNIIGKAALGRVPLWGRIFRSTYLTVDRRSAVSRGRSVVDSARSLLAGRDLIIFPEGSIGPHPGQHLLPFKDGAFRLAIEQQVPIVPVTMPYNHRFFPDLGGRLRLRRHRFLTIFHPPIFTTGMTLADVPLLRAQVREIIESALDPASEPADSPFLPANQTKG